MIPQRRNRKIQSAYDKILYRVRNLVERAFNKLKHWRRMSTRYDRKALYFLSFVKLAAAFMCS